MCNLHVNICIQQMAVQGLHQTGKLHNEIMRNIGKSLYLRNALLDDLIFITCHQ